jgi:hypothetical protein
VAGGDIGLHPAAYDVATHAGRQDPHLALIGGDISYGKTLILCHLIY